MSPHLSENLINLTLKIRDYMLVVLTYSIRRAFPHIIHQILCLFFFNQNAGVEGTVLLRICYWLCIAEGEQLFIIGMNVPISFRSWEIIAATMYSASTTIVAL